MSAPQTMRAAVVDQAGHLRIEQCPVPKLGAGELLVRVAASGICSGDVMAWYIRRKAPLVLGHEPAGTIAAIGEGASARDEDGRPFAVGDRVFVHHHAPCFACRPCARGDFVQCTTWRSTKIDPGGIAEYFRVARENQRDTLRLADSVDFSDAALIEPLACVVKSLRRSGVQAGDSLYVIGLGVMGLMHVLAAGALGAKVFGSDFLEARRVQAQACGAIAFHPDDARSTLGEGADVTICGPGTASALRAAMAATAPGGTTVMFTPLEPGTPLELDPQRLYFADLRVVASYSCGPDDTRAALRLIEDGVVTAEKLGATFISLDETPRAYADLAASRIIKPIVVFPTAGWESHPAG
ncbi:MAG: alcohol dehydrogenase catalytic domain-containing protein [Candidatus Eremiobacteraeota bacterium]|nr:alcohol dehydrogenase catalytic domain-containing protein [Candidatus Eremiobacteraeota bacterium]